MRILLVTSRITYVKDNYYHLLRELTDTLGEDIEGLCIIDNLNFNIVFSAFLIMIAGAKKTGMIVLKNVLQAFTFKRERLFQKVFYTKSINDQKAVALIKKMAPDLIINLRTRDIYKEEVLSIPKQGCINIHHGILPDNRGTMCDLWALYEKRDVGFSVHFMNKAIDAGSILKVKKIDTLGLKDYTEIPYLSSKTEAAALVGIINEIKTKGGISGEKNSSKAVRFTRNPDFSIIRKMKKAGLTL